MKLSALLGSPLHDPFFGIRHQGAAIRAGLRGALGEARATAMHMGPAPRPPHFGRHGRELSAAHGGIKGLGAHHRGHR